jgi:hypothetical protein
MIGILSRCGKRRAVVAGVAQGRALTDCQPYALASFPIHGGNPSPRPPGAGRGRVDVNRPGARQQATFARRMAARRRSSVLCASELPTSAPAPPAPTAPASIRSSAASAPSPARRRRGRREVSYPCLRQNGPAVRRYIVWSNEAGKRPYSTTPRGTCVVFYLGTRDGRVDDIFDPKGCSAILAGDLWCSPLNVQLASVRSQRSTHCDGKSVDCLASIQ